MLMTGTKKSIECGSVNECVVLRRLRNTEVRKLAVAVGPTKMAAGEEAAQMLMAELAVRLAITDRVGIPGEPEKHPVLGEIMPESVYDAIPREKVPEAVTFAMGVSPEVEAVKGNS